MKGHPSLFHPPRHWGAGGRKRHARGPHARPHRNDPYLPRVSPPRPHRTTTFPQFTGPGSSKPPFLSLSHSFRHCLRSDGACALQPGPAFARPLSWEAPVGLRLPPVHLARCQFNSQAPGTKPKRVKEKCPPQFSRVCTAGTQSAPHPNPTPPPPGWTNTAEDDTSSRACRDPHTEERREGGGHCDRGPHR